MPREAPINISDFIPREGSVLDGGLFLETPSEKRAYAKGQLCIQLRYLVWAIVMDPGPRVQDHLEMVRNVTNPDWADDPARALTDIDTLLAPMERAFDLAIAHGVPAEEMVPNGGAWVHYTRAREIFGKYHAALVKMGLMRSLPEMAA